MSILDRPAVNADAVFEALEAVCGGYGHTSAAYRAFVKAESRNSTAKEALEDARELLEDAGYNADEMFADAFMKAVP